ncbi:MAG: 50S ribosomal protein L10 [Candidatus Paceibacterota bacterium]
MPLTRTQKEKEVESLAGAVKSSASTVFVNFHGLTVDQASELRSALRENDVSYKVVKKSLTNIALDNSKIAGKKPVLEGELAIAYSDDYLEPARGVYEFQKKFEGHLSIIGGIYDGEYQSQAQMLDIALIPPKDVLRGMFVNIINSPIQGFVGALGQIAEQKEAQA